MCAILGTSSFIYNQTPTSQIYTLSLHDALPICLLLFAAVAVTPAAAQRFNAESFTLGNGLQVIVQPIPERKALDRKSTRLNSSHVEISYAVFCLKKKKLDTCVG